MFDEAAAAWPSSRSVFPLNVFIPAKLLLLGALPGIFFFFRSDAVELGVIFCSRVGVRIVLYRGSDSLILKEISRLKSC